VLLLLLLLLLGVAQVVSKLGSDTRVGTKEAAVMVMHKRIAATKRQ
jgi:hypothetical protein